MAHLLFHSGHICLAFKQVNASFLQNTDEAVHVIVIDSQCNFPFLLGEHISSILAVCRLFTLKITEEEVKALVDHTDSPYIRAVRFRATLGGLSIDFSLRLANLSPGGLCDDPTQSVYQTTKASFSFPTNKNMIS